MSLSSFLNFIGGLGLFLFGMNLLSESLQKFSDSKIRFLLDRIADKPLMSVLLGATVTGIIQSSTATTLITMGLAESGIIGSLQAVPVIMGANIGTTVTAQIIRMADLNFNNAILSAFRPFTLAPVFILIGAAQKTFFKNKEALLNASLFLGSGMLFFGIEQMETSLTVLGNHEKINQLFSGFTNPLFMIVSGAVITAVLQSSSVTVGILQTLTTIGLINMYQAVFIILGVNIGKCLPEFLASFAYGKVARVIMTSDVLINIFGCILFVLIFLLIPDQIINELSDCTATRSYVANFHTIFNLVLTFLLLPFYKHIVGFAQRINKAY